MCNYNTSCTHAGPILYTNVASCLSMRSISRMLCTCPGSACNAAMTSRCAISTLPACHANSAELYRGSTSGIPKRAAHRCAAVKSAVARVWLLYFTCSRVPAHVRASAWDGCNATASRKHWYAHPRSPRPGFRQEVCCNDVLCTLQCV